MRHGRLALAWCVLGAVLAGAGARAADTQPARVKWSATDTAGQSVSVPAKDRPTALLFLRIDQKQSREALQQFKSVLKNSAPAQVVAVISGQQDVTQIQELTGADGVPGAIVLDPDYTASGLLSVHVWPTTVLVNSVGEQTAHLPGISKSYAKELEVNLAYAAGQIDRAAMEKRLASSDVIGDTPEQMAGRHLQVAQRLLDKGQLAEARTELAEGLKLQPNNVALQVTLAGVLAQAGEAQSALAMIDQVDKNAVPGWQIHLVRGRALKTLGSLDQAKAELLEALKLNPKPAEAQYELGLIHQQQGDWQKAAEAFRAAFEASSAGQK